MTTIDNVSDCIFRSAEGSLVSGDHKVKEDAKLREHSRKDKCKYTSGSLCRTFCAIYWDHPDVTLASGRGVKPKQQRTN